MLPIYGSLVAYVVIMSLQFHLINHALSRVTIAPGLTV